MLDIFYLIDVKVIVLEKVGYFIGKYPISRSRGCLLGLSQLYYNKFKAYCFKKLRYI